MDRIEQIPTFTLLGEQRAAARVEYQVCSQCGFRLMRVETTIINDQHLKVKYCPICDQFINENLGKNIPVMGVKDRLRYFDTWLATHGLSRDVLDRHYHLAIDDFFDPVV